MVKPAVDLEIQSQPFTFNNFAAHRVSIMEYLAKEKEIPENYKDYVI